MDLFAFLRRHKGPLVEILVCGFLINLFALSLPIFSSFVYDKILGNGITETLWALAGALALLMVVEFSVRNLRVFAAERFSITSGEEIDSDVFAKLLSSEAKSLPSVGGFLDKYKQTLAYRDFLSSSYLISLVDIPFLAFFLLAIIYAAGPLVLVPLVCGGILIASSSLTAMPVLDYERIARRAGEGRFRLLTDVLSAYEAVIGGAWKNDLSARWRGSCSAASLAESRARFWRSFGNSIASSMSFLAYVGVIVGGVYMVEDRALTSGGLLAATMLSSRTMASFSSVVSIFLRYREFKTSLKELGGILPAAEREAKAPVRGRLQGGLFLDQISCRLGKEQNTIFSALSLKIQPGEIVGIAGAPGAGKTTLLRMIAGVLKPDEGTVLIDHFPVRDLAPEDLSLNIGYKPQELCLMEGTIEENIRAGRAPLSVADREGVLNLSGLGWAFEQGGLDWTTEIGSRGGNLSGGQRQLVALARAFYGSPPLLLLDEPTNGLDTELGARLAKVLLHIKGKATVLISSHSRTMLSVCDRLIVVGQGKLLADGPRDKVLK